MKNAIIVCFDAYNGFNEMEALIAKSIITPKLHFALSSIIHHNKSYEVMPFHFYMSFSQKLIKECSQFDLPEDFSVWAETQKHHFIDMNTRFYTDRYAIGRDVLDDHTQETHKFYVLLKYFYNKINSMKSM